MPVVFLLSVGDNTHIELMQKGKLWHYVKPILLAVLIVANGAGTVFATTSTSTNYQLTEGQFNAGSSLQSCSGQYCARTSIGDATGGSGANSRGSAQFGPVTDSEPLLEVIVDPGQSDLGDLTTERTATKTMIVKIRSYLSSGYTLQITGDPPKYGNHSLKTSSSPTASKKGAEQFGINAVANTLPSVGANPVQVPSSELSFGEVEDAYKTPNLFKYRSGDVLARSRTASGRTDYTISMIVNIANSTPAGHYTGDYSAVVVPVY